MRHLILCFCCFGSLASAAIRPLVETGTSPSPVGAGVRALGMGEAFVAVADDASAGSWNPAGLTQMERPEFSLVYGYEARQDDITSSRHPESAQTSSSNHDDLQYFSYVHPLEAWGKVMALSLNYQRMFAFDKNVGFPFALQSNSIKGNVDYQMQQSGEFTVLSPAFAWEPTPHLSLGVSAFIWDDSLTGASSFEKNESSLGTLAFDASIFSPSATGSVNIIDRLNLRQAYTVSSGQSFNVGLLWSISSLWKCGVVVKSGAQLKLDKTTQLQLNQTNANNGTVYNNNQSVMSERAQMNFPSSAALGVMRRFGDTGLVSFDVTYTDWANYELIEGGQTLNPVSGGTKASDSTLALRLGGEKLWLRETTIVPFRCGLGLDPEPSVEGQDLYYTGSFGTGLTWGKISLDWSNQLRFGYDVGRAAYQGLDGRATVTQFRTALGLVYTL